MQTTLIKRSDFRQGQRTGLILGISFFAIFAAFGIMARQKGLDVHIAFLTTLFIFAAPAQYPIVDMIGSGVPLWHFIVVGVTMNARFFMISLTMSHFVRHVPVKILFPIAHVVAATPFLASLFYKRANRDADFFSYFCGVAVIAFPFTLAGTLAGAAAYGNLPSIVLFASTLFLPVYFSILLTGDVKRRMEISVAALSFVLSPIAETLAPGLGMVFAAIITATVMLGIRSWMHKAGS